MSALEDFDAGWRDGWDGNPRQRGRGPSYAHAYARAVEARERETLPVDTSRRGARTGLR